MKKILFLGRFTPPMHGTARMNGLYYNVLQKEYKTKKVKINYSLSVGDIGRLSLMKFFGIFIVFFQVLYQLIIFRPNLIYFEIAPKGLAFFRDSIYVLLCKLFRRKIVFSNHARGARDEMENSLKKEYYRFIFRKTKIILLSKSLYSEFSEIYKKSDVYFLPNGIDDELSDNETSIIFKKRDNNKKLKLLFLSNMIESKGPIDALELCFMMKNAGVDFECDFVGAWGNNDFKEEWILKLKDLGLEKNCKYLGPKYDTEKKNILEKANFLIFPTRYPMECYPLVILEAFMFGIPVLSYDTAAVKEIINKDFLGFVSKKRNVGELYDYLIKNMGKKEHGAIREYFKRNFTIEIAGKKLNGIIRKELE